MAKYLCLWFATCLTCTQSCMTQENSVYQVQKIETAQSLEEVDWTQVEILTEFISPWRDAPANTNFKAVWDEDYLYFRFHVVEPNIMVYRDQDHEMEVVRSERVEIFFRKDEALNPYYCLEMDASGRVFDYEAKHYRQFNTAWTWPVGGLEVKANSTTNGYLVTGKIGIQSLNQLGLIKDQTLEVGLFRGRRTSMEESASDADFHWVSWVDPETEQPDFHVASSFGKLILVP